MWWEAKKSKVARVHAMKANGHHELAASPSRKEPQYPLNRWLGVLSEHFRDEINLLALLGIEAQLIQPLT